MIRVLGACGLALAGAAGSAVAFEPPYSVALSGVRPELEACARISGFDFTSTSRPTVPQLSRMCDSTACSAVLNHLLTGLTAKDSPTMTSNTAAFVAFGSHMLNYCWFFRSPGDACPESPHYDVASRLAVWDNACRNQTNYSFQFKDKSVELEIFRRTSVAVSYYLKVCAVPECADILVRMDYLTQVDPCVNLRAVGPYDMSQSQVAAIFDSQCRDRYPQLYPRQPGYYFQGGPSLPLNLSDPISPAPLVPTPTQEPTPPSQSSSSSSSVDAGSESSGSADATLDSLMQAPPTVRVAASPTPTSTQDQESTGQPLSLVLSPSPSASSSADTELLPSSSYDATNAPIATPSASPSVTLKRTSATTTASSPPPLPSAVASEGQQPSLSSYIPILGSVAGVVLLVCIAVVCQRRRKMRKNGGTDYQELESPATLDGAPSLDPLVGALMLASTVSISHKRVPSECLEDIHMIGAGGNGVVYLVRDTRSNVLLASKRLAKIQQTKEKIDDFVAEIQLVSTLEHPCIVTFVGASWTNRTDVQALFEYMDGGDLRTHLEAASAQVGIWSSDKLKIALDVAEALVYVHTAVTPAVVHRDIKSRNVLLSSLSRLEQNPSLRRAKLTDFGVAREQSSSYTMTTGIGTSRWLAPEVIVGGGAYDSACDIYSFGIVLSELDTHRLPFSDLNTSDQAMTEVAILTMVAIDQVQPTLSASCPPQILALAQDCMRYDPKTRPSAQDIVSRLREWVDQPSYE